MESTDAVKALGALAQETRLAIFRLLVQAGPQGVAAGQLGEALAVPPATLSFHLKELSHANLVSARQEGRFVFYSADYDQMAALMTFLTRSCCQGMPRGRLDEMETALGRCCAPSNTRTTTSRRKS